ncbi:hypothetical protein HYR69_07605, partial [Candidatus Sumerlaeota bacterium]|nr:hypothetical protein [Candidatus Sumerlaeota bacterium]
MRISGLAVRETVWDKPIAAANYRIEAKDSGAPTGASASAYIDAQNGAANFQLPWTA